LNERFTRLGWRTVDAARSVAWESAAYLWDEVQGRSTGLHDTALLSDVQQFLAVTAAALRGLDPDADDAPGMHGPWVATGLLSMAQSLLRRVDIAAQIRRESCLAGCDHIEVVKICAFLAGRGRRSDMAALGELGAARGATGF